jgi:hypothetical protein
MSTAVAEVTIQTPSGPVTTNASQTRFHAIAKAHGVTVVEKPTQNLFAATGITDGTAAELARRDATAGKAPPTAQELEASHKAQVAEFDAEMAAKGLTVQPGDGQRASPVDVDQAGVDALNKAFRKVMTQYQSAPQSAERDRIIEETRARYQTELAEFMEGRKLGEKRSEFRARKDGTPAATPPAATPQEGTAAQWELAHKNAGCIDERGFIGMRSVNPRALSCYKIPTLLPDQIVHSSIFLPARDCTGCSDYAGASRCVPAC